MPWQRQVLDVGLEIDPETGVLAYREVIVTVMRQQGKTAGVILPVELDRCLMFDDPQRVIYTAQNGSDARDKLLNDQVPAIENCPLRKTLRQVYRARGEEALVFRTGSRIELAASKRESGHGFTVDLGVLDECWADEDNRREQAILPATVTRPWAQMWLTSTQGTSDSLFLNRKTELGRAAAREDRGSGIAYFEWSIPDDADIEDPETWWAHMPALGWTIQPAAIAHALQTMVRDGEEDEWRRAYGNQCVRRRNERVIPAAVWEMAQDATATMTRDARVVFGIDVHPERGSAAISVSDGRVVGIVEHRSGTGWVVERALRLRERWGGQFVIDGGGPAASLADDLEEQNAPVTRLTNAEVAAACARMYDSLADGRVRVRSDERLDAAVAGLAKRPVGDRFVWDRRVSTSDITPFMAATLAFSVSPEQTAAPLAAWT